MSAHTPGPWEWRNDRLVRYEEEGVTPIGVGAGTALANCDPTTADRALIAAAPDLLEQLRDLLAMVGRQVNFNDDRDGGTKERCAAVIAKAEGRS